MTNGNRLPVVLSVNCSSGAYDYDETSFASEALVKAGGGAVGVFGDTRDSPSTANTQMSLGFVDALLPSVLPVEGPAVKQRTGDALNWGKLRLNGISPLPNGTTRSEFYLWHYYGDPSMQMWGGRQRADRHQPGARAGGLQDQAPVPGDPPYEVNVAGLQAIAGQPVSLLHNGQVIGKAFVGADGTATIAPSFGDGSVKPGELEIGADGQGVQPFKVPVTGVPPVTTTLTQSCPADTVLSGNLLAGTITVTGTLARCAGRRDRRRDVRRVRRDHAADRDRQCHHRRRRRLDGVAAGRAQRSGQLGRLVVLRRDGAVRRIAGGPVHDQRARQLSPGQERPGSPGARPAPLSARSAR